MSIITDYVGAAAAGGPNQKSDAYTRLLNWEALATQRRGVSRLARYRTNWLYYSGENLPQDQYVQPLEINYLRATCEAHTSYLWGQWEPQGSMVSWTIRPRSGKGDQEIQAEIISWANTLFAGQEDLLYSSGLNQSIYGDCVLRPRWDPLMEMVLPESVLPEYFHTRWSAHDINRLLETIMAYPISREEAFAEFGTKGNEKFGMLLDHRSTGFAMYWEYWTPTTVQKYIDNVLVFESDNPTSDGGMPGIIPFVHVPNVRTGGEFYGQSDIESVLRLQDDLNRKIADNGDIISYSAHPIILLKKFFGRSENLPIGPDAIWDLGREGEAEYLSLTGKLPVDIDKYVDRILAMFQDLSYMPAAAFGRSETAQASALALAMEMMPVTQRVNWKRLHWKQGLIQYLHAAARVADREKALPFKRSDLNKYIVEPQFAPVLPKDRSAAILENVSLVTNGLRTIQRALEDLGERNAAAQAAEIIAELTKKVELGIMKNQQLGGKNGSGNGGSPETGAEARDRSKNGGR